MALQGLAVLAIAAVAIFAFSKAKDKGKLPKMLSDDCTELLMTSATLDMLRWQDDYVAKHPLPPKPSDAEVLRDWIASFVRAFMQDAAPQCTRLFQVEYQDWPTAAMILYERLVFNAAVWLEKNGYDVSVPPPPKEF